MHPCASTRQIALALLLAAALPGAALAQHKAHVHGVVNVNVAVQGPTLSVQIEAPLDSLLGFEHRPRTEAQRKAAAEVTRQLNDGTALLRPAAAANCTLGKVEVDASALQPAQAAKTEKAEPAHADVDARYEYTCATPAQLTTLDLALFDTFTRISRVDVQVAGAQGQARQTLRRPARQVQLRR
jgi:hypothetical protein